MPFYFASPYAPADIWRFLEAYNPTPYAHTIGAGVLQWMDIINVVGRGHVVSLVNMNNGVLATNYRMSVDGGAWILFSLGWEMPITMNAGFAVSMRLQHQRTVAQGVDSLAWVNLE